MTHKNKFQHNNLSSEDGFTLIEVMLALMVLTIGILGMMVMQTTSITSNYKASAMTTASNIAVRQIESLRNMPFSTLAAGNTVDPSTGYPLAWAVAPIAGVPDAMLVTVTVTRPQGMRPVIYQYTKFRDL